MTTRRKKTYSTETETESPVNGESLEESPNSGEYATCQEEPIEAEIQEEEEEEEGEEEQVVTPIVVEETLQEEAPVALGPEESLPPAEIQGDEVTMHVKKVAKPVRPQPLPKRHQPRNIPRFI